MSWAKHHIEKLQQGEEVSFRPKGNSMKGKIDSGDLVKVSPDTADLAEGDVVLCKVKGNCYLHLIKATKTVKDKKLFLIGNNKGGINGWVGSNGIFGRVTEVDPNK
jgi:phage repressor protein C with HTH and peptisase S24 domain